MKKNIFITLFVLISLFSFSQSNSDFKKSYLEAKAYINEENYEEALKIFIKLYNISPSNANISYNAG